MLDRKVVGDLLDEKIKELGISSVQFVVNYI
jgi:hypothetical protein